MHPRVSLSQASLSFGGSLRRLLRLAFAAESGTTLRDDFWGFSFDHHGIPSTDMLEYQEVEVFSGLFDKALGMDGGLRVSRRFLSGAETEELFDRWIPVMDAEGTKLLGKKQNIVIGGMPAVWATFRNFQSKEMTIYAFTKTPAGQPSWWFYGHVIAEPAKVGPAMGALRQSILSFKTLQPGEAGESRPTVYVLPGKFQIQTLGFAKVDGTLNFDVAERAVEASLDAGGGRVATISLKALRVRANKENTLAEIRTAAAEKQQTVVEAKDLTVSGREAVRMKLKGPPNETVTDTLYVWDGELIWKLSATEDTTKQKSPLFRKFFAESLDSFRLLHEPAK